MTAPLAEVLVLPETAGVGTTGMGRKLSQASRRCAANAGLHPLGQPAARCLACKRAGPPPLPRRPT